MPFPRVHMVVNPRLTSRTRLRLCCWRSLLYHNEHRCRTGQDVEEVTGQGLTGSLGSLYWRRTCVHLHSGTVTYKHLRN